MFSNITRGNRSEKLKSEILLIKCEQNHRAPGTYINNDYTNIEKSKCNDEIELKTKKQTENTKIQRDVKLVFRKDR